MVMSVQLCIGLKVLNGWDLHPLNELASLAEVLGQFASCNMEGCLPQLLRSNSALPEDF